MTMSCLSECKLMAGHPPAVKAGGTRIIQHKIPKDDSEDNKSNSPPKSVTISGILSKGDYPSEAVQQFREKPIPTHVARPVNCSRTVVIQQPRK